MRNRTAGYTIVEILIVLLIVAVFIAVLAAVFGKGCSKVSGRDRVAAETSAMEFAKKLGGGVLSVDCVNVDSDGDGYVSCTIFRKDKNPFGIECAGAWTFNEGCRIPKRALITE